MRLKRSVLVPLACVGAGFTLGLVAVRARMNPPEKPPSGELVGAATEAPAAKDTASSLALPPLPAQVPAREIVAREPHESGLDSREKPAIPEILQNATLHFYADSIEFNPDRKVPTEEAARRLLTMVEEWGAQTEGVRAAFDIKQAEVVAEKSKKGDCDVFPSRAAFELAQQNGYSWKALSSATCRVHVVFEGEVVKIVRVTLDDSPELSSLWVQTDTLRKEINDKVKEVFRGL